VCRQDKFGGSNWSHTPGILATRLTETGVWNSGDFCVCRTVCAFKQWAEKSDGGAVPQGVLAVGGWVRLSAKNQRDAPFLPSGILPRTRNGKCGLLAHSLRNDGKDGSLLRHSRQNSVKSSSLAVRPDTFQLLPGMPC
jgi:hypothetical protein